MGVEDDCVCATPKVFVGQIPAEVRREMLSSLFDPYGQVIRIDMLTPRQLSLNTRSAMVWFESWTDVERVISASEQNAFHLSTIKKLVVRIADPPKRGDQCVGIKPRKLFIGQIPREVKESAVRELFANYGRIEEFEVPKRFAAVCCAFVRYEKWSEAEGAIQALNEKHKFPESKRALVVKFADAKSSEKSEATGTQLTGEKRPLSPEDRYECCKRHITSIDGRRSGVDPLDMGYVASRMGTPMGLGTLAGMGRIDWVHKESHRFLTGMNGSLCMTTISDLARSTHSSMSESYPIQTKGSDGEDRNVYLNPEMFTHVELGIDDPEMVKGDDVCYLESSLVELSRKEPPIGPNGKLGKGFTDPKVKEWTLFVGQIPHQADEYTLWEAFAAFGEILELNILRKDGKHRGCAFVTFSTKQSALSAIRCLNGNCLPWDPNQRKLVVRFREKGSKP